jgi:antitoxin (DNA-binding transcriptional repressor) of toxin-antitoxin stability system
MSGSAADSRYHECMAVIHISRSEAAGDFDGLIARASGGDEIVIEENAFPVAVLHPAARPHVRLLSESLRMARERRSAATLDGEFEKDLTAVIHSHLEPLKNPWG